jgi:hypothetical protein
LQIVFVAAAFRGGRFWSAAAELPLFSRQRSQKATPHCWSRIL